MNAKLKEDIEAHEAKPKRAKASPHLADVAQRITALTKRLCDAVLVDTIEEARLLFDVLRNDAHVMRALRSDRDELEFLLRRQKDLTPSETTNG